MFCRNQQTIDFDFLLYGIFPNGNLMKDPSKIFARKTILFCKYLVDMSENLPENVYVCSKQNKLKDECVE